MWSQYDVKNRVWIDPRWSVWIDLDHKGVLEWACGFRGLTHSRWKTHRGTYTEKTWQKPPFPRSNWVTAPEKHRSFYTEKLLHANTFAHRSFCTKKLFDRRVFTWRRLCTQKLAHTEVLAHTGLCSYTDFFLHREALPQSSFVTVQNRKFVSVYAVCPSFPA